MLAITSLLTQPHARLINQIIKHLEEKFGLDDVQATPDPHLTFQLADDGKRCELKEVLAEVAAATAPFAAFTTGLGLFPGQQPVIYIPVLRSDALNALHRRIRRAVAPLGLRADRFSEPDRWLPHISLALHDTSPGLLGPVLRYLNEATYNLELEITNLAILRQQDGLFIPEDSFALTGPIPAHGK